MKGDISNHQKWHQFSRLDTLYHVFPWWCCLDFIVFFGSRLSCCILGWMAPNYYWETPQNTFYRKQNTFRNIPFRAETPWTRLNWWWTTMGLTSSFELWITLIFQLGCYSGWCDFVSIFNNRIDVSRSHIFPEIKFTFTFATFNSILVNKLLAIKQHIPCTIFLNSWVVPRFWVKVEM